MASSGPKGSPIEGLSKREQSKLERLMEAEKTQKHSKSYKRKPPKGKHPQEPPQRKLIKTQSSSNRDRSNEDSSSHPPESKSKPLEPSPQQQKPPKVERKHLNPAFLQEGSQENIVDYLLMYSFTEKGKKMEEEQEDLTFLEQLEGINLQPMSRPDLARAEAKLAKKFEEERGRIETPFDEEHRQFNKKFCRPQYLGTS